MLVLAFDTATQMSTVAVASPDKVLAASSELVGTRHAEVTIKQIAETAKGFRSELTHVAVGVGPGPYTSTRVGVATALGIGAALGIPVVGVCTLDAIAVGVLRQFLRDGHGGSDASEGAGFGVATDARRREIYWAEYSRQAGLPSRTRGPLVAPPTDVFTATDVRQWAGDGLARYHEAATEFGRSRIEPSFPEARDLAALAIAALVTGDPVLPALAPGALSAHGGDGRGVVPVGSVLLAPQPLYLRRPDAQPTPTTQAVVS